MNYELIRSHHKWSSTRNPDIGLHCTGTPRPSPPQLPRHGPWDFTIQEPFPPDMFKLVHYEARVVGSGWFASYWNAFLLFLVTSVITGLKTRMILSGEVGDIFNIHTLKIMWRSRPFGVKVTHRSWSNSQALLHKVIILTQEQYRTEIIVFVLKTTIDIWLNRMHHYLRKCETNDTMASVYYYSIPPTKNIVFFT